MTKIPKHARYGINYVSKESDYQQLSLTLHFKNNSPFINEEEKQTRNTFISLVFFSSSKNVK
jgi:hypothetical protein